jgi:hypothetical protein
MKQPPLSPLSSPPKRTSPHPQHLIGSSLAARAPPRSKVRTPPNLTLSDLAGAVISLRSINPSWVTLWLVPSPIRCGRLTTPAIFIHVHRRPLLVRIHAHRTVTAHRSRRPSLHSHPVKVPPAYSAPRRPVRIAKFLHSLTGQSVFLSALSGSFISPNTAVRSPSVHHHPFPATSALA